MPGLNGVELARRVRSIAPKLPIVFASGYADGRTFGSELDDERLLKKPFRIAEVASRISFALNEPVAGGNVVELRR